MECIENNVLNGWKIFSTKPGCRAFMDGGKLYLLEWTEYYIEGTNNDLREVLINGKPAKRLKNGFFLYPFGIL